MCRSYHTGRDHPACDAVLRHAPVASLDGTLHRQLHALEQSPAYCCRSKWPRIGSGNFALTELIASSTCWRSAVSLPVFRNCIIEPHQLEQALFYILPLHRNFNIFSRERRKMPNPPSPENAVSRLNVSGAAVDRHQKAAEQLQSTSPDRCTFGLCSHPVLLKRERLPLRPEAFRTARRPPPLSPHQSRPGPNQRALAICRRG
jgi:hypothetical protein